MAGVIAVACGAIGASADADRPVVMDDLTREHAQEALRAHNAWRERAGEQPLRWSWDLARLAQERATHLADNGCVIRHDGLPVDLGENLYKSSALMAHGRPNVLNPVSPTQVVDAWGNESKDYSARTGTCAPGRQCGHYTQIVWRSTKEVGCGMAICPSLGQVWVCNYRPRGNIRIIR